MLQPKAQVSCINKKARPKYAVYRDLPENKAYTQTKTKGMDSRYFTEIEMKTGVAILISDKTDFKTMAL